MRIALCHAQVAFAHGGAEAHVESLREALQSRGHAVALVQLPFSWHPRSRLARSCLAWRLLDLTPSSVTPADLVIATKFPAYYVRHPNKRVWLVQQFRQAYDLAGTAFSDFQGTWQDRAWQRALREADNRVLREAHSIHTISRNTASRLKRFNGIDAHHLYPPPPRLGRYHCERSRGYILSVGRLEPLKRPGLLVNAMASVPAPIRCVMVGDGVLLAELRGEIERSGLGGRIDILPHVEDEQLVELYAGATVVYYGPVDEDYGYVTLESMSSAKPVITLEDSGGPLEFVEHGVTGWVVEPTSRAVAGAIGQAFEDPEHCEELGRRGQARVAAITWDHVVNELVTR